MRCIGTIFRMCFVLLPACRYCYCGLRWEINDVWWGVFGEGRWCGCVVMNSTVVCTLFVWLRKDIGR